MFAVAAIRTCPPVGQLTERCSGRRLIFGAALTRIVDIPTDLALHFGVVGNASISFGIEFVDDVAAASVLRHSKPQRFQPKAPR